MRFSTVYYKNGLLTKVFIFIAILFLHFSILAQEEPPEISVSEKNIWEQLADYETFKDAVTLLVKFADEEFTDSLEYFSHKLGIPISAYCYFHPDFQEIYPIIGRNIALHFSDYAESSGEKIVIRLSFLPSNNIYEINSNVSGLTQEQNDQLEYYINYNLESVESLTSQDIIDELYFSLHSFSYNRNVTLLCDVSEIKRYVEDALEEMLDENEEELNSLVLSIGILKYEEEDEEIEIENNEKFEMVDGGIIGKTIKGKTETLSLSDIQNMASVPYPVYDLFFTKDEIDIIRQLLMMNRKQSHINEYLLKENLCVLILEIEETKEESTNYLFDLLNTNNVDKLRDSLKEYLNSRIVTAN